MAIFSRHQGKESESRFSSNRPLRKFGLALLNEASEYDKLIERRLDETQPIMSNYSNLEDELPKRFKESKAEFTNQLEGVKHFCAQLDVLVICHQGWGRSVRFAQDLATSGSRKTRREVLTASTGILPLIHRFGLEYHLGSSVNKRTEYLDQLVDALCQAKHIVLAVSRTDLSTLFEKQLFDAIVKKKGNVYLRADDKPEVEAELLADLKK